MGHYIQHRKPEEGRYLHQRARIFCDNGALLIAGQGSNSSSRSKRLTTRFLGVRDCIIDKKLVSDHMPIKDQLSGMHLSRSLFEYTGENLV